MDTDKYFGFLRSKTFVIIIICIFGLALMAGIFSIGAFVGYRKARFSYDWGINYQKNFGGPRGGFMGDMMGDFNPREIVEGHGVFGQIIQITRPSDPSQSDYSLIIKSKNNIEKVVLINAGTLIRKMQSTVSALDLKVDNLIIVIGDPNNSGQIAAKFIRIMPAIPTLMPMRQF